MLLCPGTAIAGAALTGALARGVHAAEDNTLKIALVGCGGRGSGAASNALSTAGPTKLVAMADVFRSRVDASHKQLVRRHAKEVELGARAGSAQAGRPAGR